MHDNDWRLQQQEPHTRRHVARELSPPHISCIGDTCKHCSWHCENTRDFVLWYVHDRLDDSISWMLISHLHGPIYWFCLFVYFILFNSSPRAFQMKTPTSQRSKKQALEEQEKAKTKERERNVITSLQGCYVEMGMLGITHTFGAVSVLEIRYLETNKEQMLMSCLNLLKISLSKWWWWQLVLILVHIFRVHIPTPLKTEGLYSNFTADSSMKFCVMLAIVFHKRHECRAVY